MKYLVVIERTGNGYSAYVPDLPGCVAAASTKPKVKRLMHEAIALHLAGLQEDAITPPKPRSTTYLTDAFEAKKLVKKRPTRASKTKSKTRPTRKLRVA